MAIVEYECIEPSLFYYGGFKLLEYPDKISASLDYMFSEIFINPWVNWDKIRRVFETFGTSSTVSNASFSKNEDIGDGIKTQWMMNVTSNGVLVQCYNIANELGILVDSTSSEITFAAVPSAQERVARKKWQALATQYQIIKTIQTTQMLVAYGCSPLIDSENELSRSPQQLQMYQNYLAKTTITAQEGLGAVLTESALYRVSYQTLSVLFSTLIGILRGDWWRELLTLSPFNVEYETKKLIYTITAGDKLNDYFSFSSENYVAHIEYVVALPEDATGDVSVTLKECYGIEYGVSQTWNCSTCEYAADCEDPFFLNPYKMDRITQNKMHIDGVAIDEDDRVRVCYKKVSVV